MAGPATTNTGPGDTLASMMSAVKNVAQAANQVAFMVARLRAAQSSGQLSANTALQTGFVRLQGYSVTTAGAIGTLHDAKDLASAGAGNQVGTIPATVGYQAVDMVFENGLVYKPGAAQVATLFYSRL